MGKCPIIVLSFSYHFHLFSWIFPWFPRKIPSFPASRPKEATRTERCRSSRMAIRRALRQCCSSRRQSWTAVVNKKHGESQRKSHGKTMGKPLNYMVYENDYHDPYQWFNDQKHGKSHGTTIELYGLWKWLSWGKKAILGGELPTNRQWVSSPQL